MKIETNQQPLAKPRIEAENSVPSISSRICTIALAALGGALAGFATGLFCFYAFGSKQSAIGFCEEEQVGLFSPNPICKNPLYFNSFYHQKMEPNQYRVGERSALPQTPAFGPDFPIVLRQDPMFGRYPAPTALKEDLDLTAMCRRFSTPAFDPLLFCKKEAPKPALLREFSFPVSAPIALRQDLTTMCRFPPLKMEPNEYRVGEIKQVTLNQVCDQEPVPVALWHDSMNQSKIDSNESWFCTPCNASEADEFYEVVPSLNVQNSTLRGRTLAKIGSSIRGAFHRLPKVCLDPIPLIVKTSLLSCAAYLQKDLDHRIATPARACLALAAIKTIRTGLFSTGEELCPSIPKIVAAGACVCLKLNGIL